MAETDVEIVTEFTRRFAAGDHVTDEYFHPEIVWDTTASGLPSAGVYHGRDGVRRFFGDWLAPWNDYEIEGADCIDVGAGVLLVFRQAGTGRESGVRTERDFFGLWELEAGKVVRFRLFASRTQAFEAAGLRGPATSEQSVERVREWLAALSGKGEDFDRALTLVHDDIVFLPPGDQPAYHGAQSVRRWMEPEAFQEQDVRRFEPVLVRDTKILGRQFISARGASSGIELDVVTWSVWTFDDDGLITRIEIFREHEGARARKAAGLSD